MEREIQKNLIKLKFEEKYLKREGQNKFNKGKKLKI